MPCERHTINAVVLNVRIRPAEECKCMSKMCMATAQLVLLKRMAKEGGSVEWKKKEEEMREGKEHESIRQVIGCIEEVEQ